MLPIPENGQAPERVVGSHHGGSLLHPEFNHALNSAQLFLLLATFIAEVVNREGARDFCIATNAQAMSDHTG